MGTRGTRPSEIKNYGRKTKKHLETIVERAARLADGGSCDFFYCFDRHFVDSWRVARLFGLVASSGFHARCQRGSRCVCWLFSFRPLLFLLAQL
jgi:hypothetical protein